MGFKSQVDVDLKVALIGYGYQGQRLLKYLDEVFDVQYVFGRSLEKNDRFTNNIEEAFNSDAVVVATPMNSHYNIVKSALLRGKNVLSEKPLALKAEECEELGEIAKSKGLLLLTEYTYTFSTALKKAEEAVKSGEIGSLLSLQMSVKQLGRFGRENVYWLLASHMLAVLDMFVPLKELRFKRNDLLIYHGQVETGIISFTNGITSGQIAVSLNYPGKETEVVIYGEKGTIIYDPLQQLSLRVVKYHRTRDMQCHYFYIDEAHNFRNAVEYFHKALNGEAADNITRAIDITRVLDELQPTTI